MDPYYAGDGGDDDPYYSSSLSSLTNTTPPMSNASASAAATATAMAVVGAAAAAMSHATLSSSSSTTLLSSSATAELQHYLSIPPPSSSSYSTSLLQLQYSAGKNHSNNNNPMAVAHAALETLRNNGDPRFLFLRTILELTAAAASSTTTSSSTTTTTSLGDAQQQEELLFHCITGCRQVLLWHWSTGRFSREFRITVRDFFMVLGCALRGSNSSTSTSSASSNASSSNRRVVRMACFTACVALWKRGWRDDDEIHLFFNHIQQQQQQPPPPSPEEQSLIQSMQNSLQLPSSSSASSSQNGNNNNIFGSGKEQLFAYIETLLLQKKSNGNPQAAVVDGCLLLSSLVTEFAAKSSAISYRVSLEFHKHVHVSFEKGGGGCNQTSSSGRSSSGFGLTTCLRLVLTALSQVVTQLSQSNHPHGPETGEEQILLERANAVVTCTIDVLSWEFGVAAWETGKLGETAAATGSGRRALIQPPVEWREYLIQGGAGTDLLRALTHLHSNCIQRKQQHHHQQQQHHQRQQQNARIASGLNQQLARNLRQLLILLASLSGPIFQQGNPQERQEYASFLVEASLQLLQQQQQSSSTSELLDTLQLISRIVANFLLSILSQIPATVPLFQTMTTIGIQLLHDQVRDLELAGGDVDAIVTVAVDSSDDDDALSFEGRQEALNSLLDSVVLLSSDPWLLFSGTEASRQQAQQQLSTLLGRPLYHAYCTCRIKMAAMEEHYLVRCETELDEVREDISAALLEDEVESISAVGRLNLNAAMECLSALHAQTMPRLQALWAGESSSNNSSLPMLTPENAALLEEARLLILFISQLLTDENEGESPAIPQAVLSACEQQQHQQAESASPLTHNIASAVEALLQVADVQVHRMAENPSNVLLSPILAITFLTFLQRWAPAYIYPMDYASSSSTNSIVHAWSTPEKAQQVVTFCLSLCFYYLCYWPHEKQVQEGAARLLLLMARRGGPLRASIVASPVFLEMVKFHCLTAGIRHLAPQSEFEAIVQSKWTTAASASAATAPPTLQSMNMIWGYQRLPYQEKSRILSVIIVACSDGSDAKATALLSDALTAVHEAFASLVRALDGKEVVHDDVNAKEMTVLCLEMFCGVAAAEATSQEECIVPQFITPHLRQLAGLMRLYATDLTVCETLLRFFCSYTEQYVAILNREQSMELFNASAELLRCYSVNHCSANRRVVVVTAARNGNADAISEEEQAYNDILCATQLLINLGTKDFIDACSTDQQGVDSSQVTDIIFLGLQQILPLMTQGLLQFPTLCLRFFDLVGFMADTYPEKVCQLPYDLFDSLLQALLFGMTHHNPSVAHVSLHGLASIAREHLQTQRQQQQQQQLSAVNTVGDAALDRYLAVRPDY
jgi:CRM1 C terminal